MLLLHYVEIGSWFSSQIQFTHTNPRGPSRVAYSLLPVVIVIGLSVLVKATQQEACIYMPKSTRGNTNSNENVRKETVLLRLFSALIRVYWRLPIIVVDQPRRVFASLSTRRFARRRCRLTEKKSLPLALPPLESRHFETGTDQARVPLMTAGGL